MLDPTIKLLIVVVLGEGVATLVVTPPPIMVIRVPEPVPYVVFTATDVKLFGIVTVYPFIVPATNPIEVEFTLISVIVASAIKLV